MEQMIDVARQWADQVGFLEAFHADGALWSTYAFYYTHFVHLFHARFIAVVLSPIVWIALLESVLHISIDFSTILAKYDLFKIL